MAKAKTQSELAELFAQGAKEGTVTFLSIIGDVIYNTEEEKYGRNDGNYLALAIRLTEKVALLNHRNKGSQCNDHRKKVNEALEHAGYLILDAGIMGMKTPGEVPQVTESCILHLTKELEATVEGIKKDIANNPNPQYPADYQARLAIAERKQRALTLYKDGAKHEVKKVTLDILTELPEILEKAIKEKHIDDGKLQEIIAARAKGKSLIDEVDKYLALILSIPTTAAPEPEPEPATRGIILTG